MANEIMKQEPNYYEKYGDAAAARNIVGKLLKFTKFGEYRAGVENEEVPIGTDLVAYMPSLAVGYVRWEDNRPAQTEVGYIGEGYVPPRRNDLGFNNMAEWECDDKGAPRDPWQFTNSLIFIDLHKGCLYTFNTSSRGGLGAMTGLSKIYGRHKRTKPRELPTIKLGVDSYRHSNKAYGEIRFPVFKIVDDQWFPVDDLPLLEGLPEFVEGEKYVEKTLKQEFAGDEIPF